jgi:hypothetical protein
MSGIYDPPNHLASLVEAFERAQKQNMYGAPNSLASLVAAFEKTQKRKVYFSFHFADVMRVNNVRQAWKIDHPDAATMRSFYDSSLWENRQSESPESLKRLIRDGVEYTSAVCVLVGSGTWARRWVRYELARAVIDGRGLLAVHLNNIRHHLRLQPDPRGPNPLEYMAIGKVQPNALAAPRYYLFEWNGHMWVPYEDYTDAVSLPRYLADPPARCLAVLSAGTATYDYIINEGHKNIGAWIDKAAQQVGR